MYKYTYVNGYYTYIDVEFQGIHYFITNLRKQIKLELCTLPYKFIINWSDSFITFF